MSIYSALQKTHAKKAVGELEESQEAAQKKEGKLLGMKHLAGEGLKMAGKEGLKFLGRRAMDMVLPGSGVAADIAAKAMMAGKIKKIVDKGKMGAKIIKGVKKGKEIYDKSKTLQKAVKWGKGAVEHKLAADVTEKGLRGLGMGAKPSDIKSDSIYTDEAAKSIKKSMVEGQTARKKDWSEAAISSAYANLGYDEETGTFKGDEETPKTSVEEPSDVATGDTLAPKADLEGDTSDASQQEQKSQLLQGQGIDEEDFNSWLQNKYGGDDESVDTSKWTEKDLQEYMTAMGG